jgi:hypothetical protein
MQLLSSGWMCIGRIFAYFPKLYYAYQITNRSVPH